jgi:DNA-binding NarL/FixJ family response regulator
MIIVKKKASIGISDDHPRVREVMKSCLSMLEYPVILEAENGKVLIEKLDPSMLPDVCLIDINMPEMNGYETASYLKHNWPSVKVLMYSMNDEVRTRDKAFQSGADGYLVKPSTMDEIEDAIEKLVQL